MVTCKHNYIELVSIARVLRLITITCFIYKGFYNRKLTCIAIIDMTLY